MSAYNPVLTKGYPWIKYPRFRKGGFPLPLTGYTATAQIKSSYTDSSPVSITTEIITTGDANVLKLSLTRAQVDAIAYTTGVWDLRLVDPSGNPMLIVGGVVTIKASVTQTTP